MDEPFVAVGLRIRALRGGLSLREFAARLGVDHKSVSGWESGKRLPDGSSLLALMEQFGADVNYILTGLLTDGGAPTAAPTLARDEEILLDNYRHCPPDAQAAIKATSDALARAACDCSRGKAA
jgi:transcriptional regulator with XRE-family HTH domain